MDQFRNQGDATRVILLEDRLARALQVVRDLDRIARDGRVTDAEFRMLGAWWTRDAAALVSDAEFAELLARVNRRIAAAFPPGRGDA